MPQEKDCAVISKTAVSSEVEPDTSTAEGFLKVNGFEDLIPVLVIKNKFKVVDDLRLLANNIELVKTLDLPLCSILKLTTMLKKMEQEDEEKSLKSQQKQEKAKELSSKKELLKLCKTELSAQAANHAWNKFNNLINNKLKALNLEGKWKGSGGLKACPGTTEEESKLNLELCNTILDDPDLKSMYGVYRVADADQVTLDKAKGRKHISNIMCSLRKPSAYQNQASKNGSRKRACRTKAEESNSVPEKVQKVDSEPEVRRKLVPKSNQKVATETEANDQNVHQVEEEACNHNENIESEMQKKKKINELKMLESGFVDRDQAIIVALHYLKAKTVSNVTLKKLKPALKSYCILCMKDSAKEDLLRSLGRVLYERKIVLRKNNKEVITHNNLTVIPDA